MKTKKNVGIKRGKADEIIAWLRERALIVNADPQFLYGVARLIVFGSYLTDKVKLGDLDIAIELGPKCKRVHLHEELLCMEQERSVPVHIQRDLVARVFWPRWKVMRALLGRNYAISFHEYDEFKFLRKEGIASGKLLYRNKQFDR